MSSEDQQRLDKWLWAARFFKTRALAAEAISGGRAHLNGDRVKPARNVKVGDRVSVTKGQFEFHLVILGLNNQRRPAQEAQALYVESEESIEKRQALSLSMKILNANRPFSDKRPTKKQRRQISRFKRTES